MNSSDVEVLDTAAAQSPQPFLPFHRPCIGRAEIRAAVQAMKSGWITTGPEVKRFEAEFAEFVGAPHAVALSSCTAALHLALAVIDLKPGDEVVLPTITFASTAEVVQYFGARPVLCDVLPTLNLDPDDVERRITPRTRAIIVVHFAGQPAGLDAIRDLARRHGLVVIEDAAHALPATYHGQMIGNLSDITCFSFYATKTLTTGEGGMLTTANASWADRARSLALHGISRDAWKRYSQGGNWFYEILEPGYKYNMTDVQAGIGRVQLRRQATLLRARRRLATRYRHLLQGLDIEYPAQLPEAESAWHLFVILLSPRPRCGRDDLMAGLKERGIGASVHFIPLHTHPLYRDRFGYRVEDLPQAWGYYQRMVSLPLFPQMTPAEQSRVTDAVRALLS